MLLFEEEPALGLFPLMLFVRTLDDIVENRAEVGLYFEPLGVQPANPLPWLGSLTKSVNSRCLIASAFSLAVAGASTIGYGGCTFAFGRGR